MVIFFSSSSRMSYSGTGILWHRSFLKKVVDRLSQLGLAVQSSFRLDTGCFPHVRTDLWMSLTLGEREQANYSGYLPVSGISRKSVRRVLRYAFFAYLQAEVVRIAYLEGGALRALRPFGGILTPKPPP